LKSAAGAHDAAGGGSVFRGSGRSKRSELEAHAEHARSTTRARTLRSYVDSARGARAGTRFLALR
jgi:hypothetical protein